MAATKNRRCSRERNRYFHQIKLNENLTVDCVCPKCGTHHTMKMLWTGRGKPKKFCQACKIFVSSIESTDFFSMPPKVNARIE
jgi:uncharacterized protein (DUF983 family)